MNKKHKWKKLGKIFMIIVAFAAIVGAAVYSVVKKRIDAQVVMIYEESTVQKGSLKNEYIIIYVNCPFGRSFNDKSL